MHSPKPFGPNHIRPRRIVAESASNVAVADALYFAVPINKAKQALDLKLCFHFSNKNGAEKEKIPQCSFVPGSPSSRS